MKKIWLTREKTVVILDKIYIVEKGEYCGDPRSNKYV